jgi:hypothetical protein
MNPSFLLKEFEYSVPVSALSLERKKPDDGQADQVPLLRLNIDFEKAILKLEADWQFLVSINQYYDEKWLGYHQQRIKLDMDIYPPMHIPDLSLGESDGLIMTLDGIMKDGMNVNTCSGLIVLDKMGGTKTETTERWILSIYLYDFESEAFEVRLRLPVIVDKYNGAYN